MVQNPEQVGTALKTLSLRIRGAKTELEDAGEDTDNMATSVASLQAKLKALTHGKVDIMLDSTTFKSTTQILREMSDVWGEMDDISKASALEMLGGKRQANILASIIKNYDTVDEVIKTSLNSQNSAYEENAKWLDSIEGKTTQFSNALQTMWMNTLNSDTVKGIVDAGTSLINTINDVGLGWSVLAATVAVFAGKNLIPALFTKITASMSASTIATAAETAALQTLTTAQINEALVAAGVADAKQAGVAASIMSTTADGKEIVSTEIKTAAQLKAVLMQKLNNEEQVAGIMSSLGLATANKTLAGSFLAVSKAILTSPYFWIAAAIVATVVILDKLIVTHKEYAKQLKEESEELKETKSNIESMNSELEETAKRIAELNNQDKLSFTDKQELANLKAQNKELERSIALEEAKAELQEKQRSYTFRKTVESDPLLNGGAIVYKNAKGQYVSSDEARTHRTGYAAGGGQVLNQGYTSENVSAIDAKIVKLKVYQNEVEKTTANLEAMNAASEEEQDGRNGWQKFWGLDTDVEKLQKARDEAVQNAEEYESELGQVIDEFYEKYGDTPWYPDAEAGSWQDESNKAYKQVFDQLDKLAIGADTTGKAVEAAFTRISSQNTFQKTIDAILEIPFQEMQTALQNQISLAGLNKDQIDEMADAYKYYSEVAQEVIDENVDLSKTKFGNIDLNNRAVVEWTDDLVKEFQSELSSWNIPLDEIAGSFSTVLGSSGEFDGIDIAFSPMLQTENGAVLLSKDTVSKYIWSIIDAAKKDDGSVDYDELFKLDTDGIEVDGRLIKNIIADVGDTASHTAEIMHYIGKDGAVADAWKAVEEAASNAGISVGGLVEIFKNGINPDIPELDAFLSSLQAAGIISDRSTQSIGKVLDLVMQLGGSSSDAAIANKKLAKSQKMLDYYKEAKKLTRYTAIIKETKGATNGLTNEDIKSVSAIKAKLSALAEEISKYDILGDKINEAKQSFTEFENAKTADSDEEYIDNASEMFKALADGFQSAKLGTETFKSALKGLIPDEVYEGAETLEGKYDAVVKYMNENLKAYFTIEYEDNGSIKSIESDGSKVQKFFEDMSKKTGPNGEPLASFANGIWKVNETDWDTFVKYSGLTKEMLYAIGVAADKYDADHIMGDNTSFFDSFDMGLEANIYKTTQSLASLDQQLIDGSIGLTEYTQKYKGLNSELEINTKEAADNIAAYNDASKKVSDAQVELAAANDALKNMDGNASYTEADRADALATVEEMTKKLALAVSEKGKLTAPSQIEITFANDYINGEIDRLQAVMDERNITIPTNFETDDRFEIGEDGKYTVKADISMNDDDRALLNAYSELQRQNNVIQTYFKDEDDAQGKVDTLKETVKETQDLLKNMEVHIDTTTAMSELQAFVAEASKPIKKTVILTQETMGEAPSSAAVSNRTTTSSVLPNVGFMNRGTAHANGNLGAKRNENGSLVGELGPEIRVRDGRFETLGQNGAEFTDVRRGDIIFNHKQTEQLLKNGHIGSRGKAYVNGNAYPGGTSGTLFTKYSIADLWGDTLPDWYDNKPLFDGLGTIIDDASEELFDFFEVLINVIDKNIELLEAQVPNTLSAAGKNELYTKIISENLKKLVANPNGISLYEGKAQTFYDKMPAKYRDLADKGAIEFVDFKGEENEEVVKNIESYIEWTNKAKDLRIEMENIKQTIADTNAEMINSIKAEYDNKIGLVSNLNDRIQSNMDLLEESGERLSSAFYEEMIRNSNNSVEAMQAERKSMQQTLNDRVALGSANGGIDKYSDVWYEMVGAINDVDAEIVQTTIDIEGFQNSINDLHWENFDKLISSIENVSDEAGHLRDVIRDDEIADENGWLQEGITALGLVAQQMENAKYRADQYGKEIQNLKKDYDAGRYSFDEYNEKLKELKDAQWDAIDGYESSKEAIVNLNQTRVSAVKDGMQKEIDAYEKLIEKRKEDLNSQKDTHDWAKTVKDHNDEIAKIQRQIDALTGDTSASAEAQRKKLQEELATAKTELDEAYYNREIEMQQKALDDTLKIYKDGKEDAMKEMDEYLEKEDQVISDSYALILSNTENVSAGINAIAERYGIEIAQHVTDPWTSATTALGQYSTEVNTATSGYIAQLESVRLKLEEVQKDADTTALALLNTIGQQAASTQAAVTAPAQVKPTVQAQQQPAAPSIKTGQTVVVSKDATNFTRDGGNGTRMASFVPGSSYTVMQTSGNEVLIGLGGAATGWVKKDDLEGYALGTNGVSKNQLAWIDEHGLEEIVMHADNGRLSYLTKGSAVLSNNLVDNIMAWGEISPVEMLDRNRPSIGAPHIENNNMQVDVSFGELVHVDTVSKDTLPDLQKMVRSEFDNLLKGLNGGIKRFAR